MGSGAPRCVRIAGVPPHDALPVLLDDGVTLISACKELMLDVFSSIGEDVMVGVGCTARRDARNSDLLKIDEIDPTYAWDVLQPRVRQNLTVL